MNQGDVFLSEVSQSSRPENFPPLTVLVRCERAQRIESEYLAVTISKETVHRVKLEDQRLAGGRSGRYDHVSAGTQVSQRL